MNLQQVGPTVISTDGKYTEDTTIRITAVKTDTDTPTTTFTGSVNLAEVDHAYYSQNSQLFQQRVTISSGGTATFTARSVANANDPQNAIAPDPAHIKTTNYPVYRK